MTTPYSALLSVRKIEEQQAEVTLAQALRELAAAQKLADQIRTAREAWLGEQLETGLAETLSALEAAEREADIMLIEAEGQAAVARETLLGRQRQRKLVEKLHEAALAAVARAEARRQQSELDDLGGRSFGAFTERSR
jgi:flagellar export protein FliJ